MSLESDWKSVKAVFETKKSLDDTGCMTSWVLKSKTKPPSPKASDSIKLVRSGHDSVMQQLTRKQGITQENISLIIEGASVTES